MLIFIDLDGFKEINDIRGHGAGDAVLKVFAQNLYPGTKQFMDQEFRGVAGAHPIIGRIGGDEFAILLPIPDHASNNKDVADLCERLRQSLPKSVIVDGVDIPCEISAGGAVYPNQGESIEDFIRRADLALYITKAAGKDRFKLYSKANALGGKSEILSAVMHAIEENEMVLEYQPKYCLNNQKITGVEALVRWNHPSHGKIAPNLFLPAIKQTQVMAKLGEWVVGRAMQDIADLDRLGHRLSVAVNIGAEHFSAPGFVPNLVGQVNRASSGWLQSGIGEKVTILVTNHSVPSGIIAKCFNDSEL